jgi:hypothetical protein
MKWLLFLVNKVYAILVNRVVDLKPIHERTISLTFLGIILRVLRLEVSVYNVYITNQF